MTKAGAAAHACSSCGHSAARWFGRCPSCGSWDTAAVDPAGAGGSLKLVPLRDGAPGTHVRLATSISEVDRVLGGGLVEGSLTLLAGEPGIGKSTLVLQMVAGLASSGAACIVVSGEESTAQVSARAGRIGVDGNVRVANSNSLTAVVDLVARAGAAVVVVDSIQTLVDPGRSGGPGSVSQVREAAARLLHAANSSGTAVVLIGHVTKDGSVAGPRTLEHLVDAVVALEGERSGGLRLLRAIKNRFGSCDETGVFAMTGAGLAPVPEPSELLLADRSAGVPGSVVFPAIEGTRCMLVEVQALVTASPVGRRVAIGYDSRRLAMLLGVMTERAGIDLRDDDVFVAVAGGFGLREPAADLAVLLALASAKRRIPVSERSVAFGEVGLAGEVRRVPAGERRAAEAARFGFDTVVCPRSALTDARLAVERAGSVNDALVAAAIAAEGGR